MRTNKPVPLRSRSPLPVGDSPLLNEDAVKTRDEKYVREQTKLDILKQESKRLKHNVASHQDRQMLETADANVRAVIDTLADGRNQPRDEWAARRAKRWADNAADASEEHQRAYYEAAAAGIAGIVERDITSPPKPKGLIARVLGDDE